MTLFERETEAKKASRTQLQKNEEENISKLMESEPTEKAFL